MRCDDCKAQPRQPRLNAAAAFGCCLRYAATVTRRNARRTIVWASLREVARRRRVKRGVLLCVLGLYSKLDRTYVRRVAVADSIPKCKQATLSDFKSTRLFDAFKALFLDSQGTVVFRYDIFEILQRTTDWFNHKIFKNFHKRKKIMRSHSCKNWKHLFHARRFLSLRILFISVNFQI